MEGVAGEIEAHQSDFGTTKSPRSPRKARLNFLHLVHLVTWWFKSLLNGHSRRTPPLRGAGRVIM
jgi:hypothetical protein